MLGDREFAQSVRHAQDGKIAELRRQVKRGMRPVLRGRACFYFRNALSTVSRLARLSATPLWMIGSGGPGVAPSE